MPIYEYDCPKCGEFEVSQRITEDPLKKCPTCRRKVKKLISQTSFQLKGSGWYITDYGRGGKTKDSTESPTKGSSDSTDSASESKSESKSDSKSESKAAETKSTGSKDKSAKGGSKGSGGTKAAA